MSIPDRQYGQGEEMHISRTAEGKIVERWGQGDNLGMM
jgi:hypothetical protein